MRFTPRPDYGQFQDAPRKRAAAERRQQRQRDALPLFAAEIAERQPTIDDEMRRRAAEWDRDERAERDRLAKRWRSIRAAIAALPPAQRQEVRDRAAHYGGPLNIVAYAYFYRETTGQHPPPSQ